MPLQVPKLTERVIIIHCPVNMLYLEQPVQVGLSYDTLANFTLDLISGNVTALDDDEPIPEQNTTFLVGTYPSQNSNNTAQGTRNAAIAMWHFAQVWFQEFPGYHPNDSRVSIATESCKSSSIFCPKSIARILKFPWS